MAEDTPENVTLLKAFLKNFPAEIYHVPNGKEALQCVKNGLSFDLILMDIEMPVMDGMEATREIRNWEKEQNKEPALVVALTAHALNSFREEGMRAGFNDFLTKPIRKHGLLEFLNKTLVNK